MPVERLRGLLALAGFLFLAGVIAGAGTFLASQTAHRRDMVSASSWQPPMAPSAVLLAVAGHDLYSLTHLLLKDGAFGAVSEEDYAAKAGRAAGGADGADGRLSGPEKKPFPDIIAAALVDRTPMIYLRHADGRVAGWSENTSPEEGWEIVSITLDAIEVRYKDDPVQHLPVFVKIPDAAFLKGVEKH
ncbi:hypothetical protein JCM17844_26150 [Iodidimonas gelatinilytica]|uniref:Uncharacterized protein n=1 Tax=Iodidimonas gelatinilytica TaxID=1236966 RepID=A0A5A7MVB4_9PROT|nr:hypothetical protein [Iodidimonas gelatinilytica]GEQ98978.1 hypothetical protein JCM17844_26150 [Iodidimonas gelatinilytica]GEQ99752.1 hypothetical protein JCM17845_03760 [Iodidimonas gelatinilytica]